MLILATPVMAAPNGGRGGVHGGVSVNHSVGRPRTHITVNRPSPIARHVVHRPPLVPPPVYRRPIPYYNAYYNGFYYYGGYPVNYYTAYDYYPTQTTTYVTQDGGTQVVVRQETPYAGLNTAANLINAAANTATAIKLLSW